jgi:hypothetical protein
MRYVPKPAENIKKVEAKGIDLNTKKYQQEIIADTGSEVPEKRATLNFLLQNPRVSDKKLVFTMAKPFGAILELAKCPTGLRQLDGFGTINWKEIEREVRW